MLFRIKYFPLAAIAIAISVLTYGCGESKVSQCNKLINVAGKSKSINVSKDKTVLNQAADSLDSIKTELQTVKLGDEKLKAFQTRFVNMYGETSLAVREVSKAKDSAEFESANKTFQAAAEKEGPLVDEINKYCAAN